MFDRPLPKRYYVGRWKSITLSKYLVWISALCAILFFQFPSDAFSAQEGAVSQYAKFANRLIAAGQFDRAIKYYKRALNYGSGECDRKKYDLLIRLRNQSQHAKDLRIGSPGLSLYCKLLKHLGFKVENLPFDLRGTNLNDYHVLIIDHLRFTAGGVKDFVRSGGIAVFPGKDLGVTGGVNYDLFGVALVFREGGSRRSRSCPYSAIILEKKHPAFSHFCRDTIKACGSSFAIPTGDTWNIVVKEQDFEERPIFFESDYGKGKYIFCLHNYAAAYDRRQKHWVDELWTLLGELAYILECAK